MTIFELETALCEFVEGQTAELRFRSNEQSALMAAPRVYAGYIPRDEVGAIVPGEITIYPAIIINAQTGVQGLDKELVTINMIIGCFDDGLDQQGYRDVCNLVQRLKDRIREVDIIHEAFSISHEDFLLNWQINRRMGGGMNSYPYFFAEMQVNFELPVMSTQFDLGVADGDVTPGRYNTTPIPTEPPIEHDKHPTPPPIKWEEHYVPPTGGIAKSIGAT